MTPKLFTVLAATAFVSLGAAVFTYNSKASWATGDIKGEKLFPALTEKMQQLDQLRLKQGDKVLTLKKKEDNWVISEKNDYPLKKEPVRSLLYQLAQAELIEPKTRKQDRYHLLELEDPSKKDAKSVEVSLFDKEDKTLAQVILGKKRWDAFGSSKSGVYVRKPGNDQTWLSSANLSPSLDVKEWVETKFFKFDISKMKELEFKQNNEENYSITPDSKGNYILSEQGNVRKTKETTDLKDIVNSYNSLELEDVRKLNSTPTGKDVSIISLTSVEGLAVEFRLSKDKESYWLSLNATGDDKAKKEAEAINEKTQGWEYKIPSWKAEAMMKNVKDIIAETS